MDLNSETFQFVIEGRQAVTLPESQVYQILGRRIFRVDDGGNRHTRTFTGHYGDPFKVLHREQDIWHGFNSPQEAFRQTLHERTWEGVPVLRSEFPDDGEHQSLMALLGTEHTLQLLASDKMMSGPEREAFERLARETAKRMDMKRNVAKRYVMNLLLQVATTGGEDSAQLFNDMLGLTDQRITDVVDIDSAVNLRSGVILREIRWQQQIMNESAKMVAELRDEHHKLEHDLQLRGEHIQMVDTLIQMLRKVKDRPYCRQAAKDIKDLLEYRQLLMGNFADSAKPLGRVYVSSQFPSYARDLHAVMFLFGTSRAHRGSKRDAILERVHQKLIELKRRIGDPARADDLQNNVLWAVVGLINDALLRLRGPRNWEATKLLVRRAIEQF